MENSSIEVDKIKQELEKFKSGDLSNTKALLQSMGEIASWMKEKISQ